MSFLDGMKKIMQGKPVFDAQGQRALVSFVGLPPAAGLGAHQCHRVVRGAAGAVGLT